MEDIEIQLEYLKIEGNQPGNVEHRTIRCSPLVSLSLNIIYHSLDLIAYFLGTDSSIS